MRTTLLDQIVKRRKALRIRSSEMTLLAGINRQQYQKIEKGGNPSLITLDKISEALDAELMLIPKDKLVAVRRVLAAATGSPLYPSRMSFTAGEKSLPEDEILWPEFDETIVDPWDLIEGKK